MPRSNYVSEANEILRRAVELDAVEQQASEERAVAVAAAREIGLSETAVAGALVRPGTTATATARIEGPADHVIAHVAEWLTRCGFARISRATGLEVWARDKKTRWADWKLLLDLQSIEVHTREESDGSTTVSLEAVRKPRAQTRRAMAMAWGGMAVGLTAYCLLEVSGLGFFYRVALFVLMLANVATVVLKGRAFFTPENATLEQALRAVRVRTLASVRAPRPSVESRLQQDAKTSAGPGQAAF